MSKDEKELVFFYNGDIVQLKQDVPNKPKMVVKRIVKSRLAEGENKMFIGIKCFWFTTDGQYCEQLFNSKDLEKC